MKKQLKIIFCITLVMLLSGCSAEYRVTINEDKTVSEKTVIKELKSEVSFLFEESGSTPSDINNYLKDLESNWTDKLNINDFEREDDTLNYRVLLNKTYSNINDFSSSQLIRGSFNTFDVTEKNNLVTVTIKDVDNEVYNTVNDYIIKVTSAYVIKNSNETTYDETTNTYTWNFDTAQKPSINFQIDFDEIYTYDDSLISIKSLKIIGYIILSVISILSITFIFIFIKGKSKNKI